MHAAVASEADTANKILRASDAQITSTAKQVAESVARSIPARIDSTTVLVGFVFVLDTKTFIYKYNSEIFLDDVKMHSYITHLMCTDKIKLAFMSRGITYKHIYITPAGQQAIAVRNSDCH